MIMNNILAIIPLKITWGEVLGAFVILVILHDVLNLLNLRSELDDGPFDGPWNILGTILFFFIAIIKRIWYGIQDLFYKIKYQ